MATTSIDPASLPGATADPMPQSINPEKATLGERVPEGEEWLYEIKHDGYRLIVFIDAGEVRLSTRRGNDWTSRFPPGAPRVFGSFRARCEVAAHGSPLSTLPLT